MRICFQNYNYETVETALSQANQPFVATPLPDTDQPSDSSLHYLADLPPSANDAGPLIEAHTPTFTGSGKEYFRIWIVNLFLTCATLGIYSAWAKVRRLQYFDRNTQLAGAVFDFGGDPKAILRGRVLAVILLAAYHYAFGFSLVAGIVVVAVLLAGLPLMMRGALRFRLRNTRYRGLNFGFSGDREDAYRSYVPAMVIIMLPTVLPALDASQGWYVLLGLLYLLWPPMHGLVKEYQHRHITFGNTGSFYDLESTRFYFPYFMAGLVMVLVFVLIIIVAAVIGAAAKIGAGNAKAPPEVELAIMGFLIGVAVIYLMYLFTSGYLHVRLTNLVWSNTRFPGIRIKSEMRLWPYYKLQIVNTLLTLLSLGLYRPFAVVRLVQYRLSCMSLEAQGSFDDSVAAAANRVSASGDGVADFLGLDLSW